MPKDDNTYGSRCEACLDPAPHDCHYCAKCHAWSDLYFGVVMHDDYRHKRAIGYFRRARRIEPVESVVAKLMRRLAFIERDIDIMVNDRITRAYIVDERLATNEEMLRATARKLCDVQGHLNV